MPRDPELAEKLGISLGTLYAAFKGEVSTRTLQKIEIAERALQFSSISAPHILREDRASYSTENDPVVGPLSPVNLQALEDRVDQAMEELISIKKELRRLRS